MNVDRIVQWALAKPGNVYLHVRSGPWRISNEVKFNGEPRIALKIGPNDHGIFGLAHTGCVLEWLDEGRFVLATQSVPYALNSGDTLIISGSRI